MAVISIQDITVNATGNAAVVRWLASESTSIQSPLAEAIEAADTTLTVSVSNWQPAAGSRLIAIENEVCAVTAKNGSVLTVTRGRGGTEAVAHAAGAMVRELRYQSVSEGLRDQIIQFIRQKIAADATVNAGVTAAQAARDAVIAAAVS